MKNCLIYIAGPLSATATHSVEQHVADAVTLWMRLLKLGIPAFCPHLSALYPSAWTLFDYEFWMAYDFAVIDRCTHVLMMVGWRESKGAVREHDRAESLGLPIAYSVEELEQFIREAEDLRARLDKLDGVL